MNSTAQQRIKDIRNDIALLEIKLDRTAKNDSFKDGDGRYINSRSVILGQLLELRMRLQKEMEDITDDL